MVMKRFLDPLAEAFNFTKNLYWILVFENFEYFTACVKEV